LQIRQGLATHRATGAELMRPYFLALLAEAYGKMAQTEACPERSRREGLTVLAEALAVVDNTGERFYEPELYRLKGELIRQKAKGKGQKAKGDSQQATEDRQKAKGKKQKAKIEAEAEACFQQAIDIACRQQAKSLELRAVMSLSRLWQHQGKHDEARQLLAETYGWFTEGFDTADLKEAKALLEELS